MSSPFLRSRFVAALLLCALVGLLPGCQKKLHYGPAEVIYDADVGEPEARALGDYLKAHEYFASGKPVTVKMDTKKDLSHSPPTYRVLFFVKDNAWQNKAFVDELQAMADETKKTIFHAKQTIFVINTQAGIEQKKIYARD